MDGETIIPTGFFDEEKYVEIRRFYEFHTYNELLEHLQTLREFGDTEPFYYEIHVRYKLYFDQINTGAYRTKTFNQLTIQEAIDAIEDYIDGVQEKYGDRFDEEFGDMDIIGDIFIRKVNPWFGASGKEFSMFRILNNQPITIRFFKTYSRCLIKSVLKTLDLDTEGHTLLHNYDRYSHLPFVEIKRHIENNLGISIKITKSLKNLERYLKNKKDRDVILFATNKHVGYLEYDFPYLQKRKQDPVPPKPIQKISNVLIMTLDCEYTYEKKAEMDEEYTSKEPTLVCLKVWGLKSDLSYFKDFVFGSVRKAVQKIISLSEAAVKNVYVYSHYGMKVEHQFIAKVQIMEHIRNNKDPRITYTNIQGSKIKTLSWKLGDRSIKFIDTVLFAPMSLEEIACSFKTSVVKGHKEWETIPNIKKDKKIKDSWYLNKNWSVSNPDDVAYCMNDVHILMEFIVKFNEFVINIYDDIYHSGDWALSKFSMSSINKNYVLHHYPNIINDSLESSIFSESYFGGRNECFQIGEVVGNIRGDDINSSYPFELLKGFAGPFVGTTKTIPQTTEHRWLALVDLHYKDPVDIPLLCVKEKGRLVFPNIMNSRIMFIWDKEYEEIKENLVVDKIYDVYLFEEINLSGLINKLYKIKSDCKDNSESPFYKNEAMYQTVKIMLNGIYGSLGMNMYRPQKKIIRDLDVLDLPYDEYETSEAFEALSWLYYSDLCQIDSAFQCASSITMQARLHLWQQINHIRSLGHSPLYCDTDSVYYKLADNIAAPPSSSSLGGWKKEFEGDYMKILTCKVYAYRNMKHEYDFKFKGFQKEKFDPPSYPEKESEEERLERENNRRAYNEDKVNSLIQNCTFVNKCWQPTTELTLVKYDITKTYSLNYNKGTVLDSGDVVPLII